VLRGRAHLRAPRDLPGVHDAFVDLAKAPARQSARSGTNLSMVRPRGRRGTPQVPCRP
jgi:hypothetical protein